MHARLLRLLAPLVLFCEPFTSAQSAEISYPARPLRIIVPGTPGGPPDITARLVAEKMSAAFGRPVIVENRPGAGFAIGIGAVAKASPDGYTLGLLPMPATVSQSLYKPQPYDAEKDLAAVSLIAWAYNILAVPATSAAKSLSDLVAAAKARPGTKACQGLFRQSSRVVQAFSNRLESNHRAHLSMKKRTEPR